MHKLSCLMAVSFLVMGLSVPTLSVYADDFVGSTFDRVTFSSDDWKRSPRDDGASYECLTGDYCELFIVLGSFSVKWNCNFRTKVEVRGGEVLMPECQFGGLGSLEDGSLYVTVSNYLFYAFKSADDWQRLAQPNGSKYVCRTDPCGVDINDGGIVYACDQGAVVEAQSNEIRLPPDCQEE